MADNQINLTVEMNHDEAWAYAEFLKRVGFYDYKNLAVDEDETRLMISAGEKIREELARQGYAPR